MAATIKSGNQSKEDPESKITTIKLSVRTKTRLDHLKIHPKESYEEIIKKVLGILNLSKANPGAARSRLLEIDRQRQINGLK